MHSYAVRCWVAGFSIQVLGLFASGAHAQSAAPADNAGKPAARTVAQAGGRTFQDRGMNLQLEFKLPAATASADAEDCEDEQPSPIAAAGPATRINSRAEAMPQQSGADRSSQASHLGSTLVAHSPAPVAAAIAPAAIARTWDITVSDKTLNAALARWAASAGWQLVWELPVDYAVEARTSVPGSFEDAVSQVARSMESAEVPMKAIFYQGNKVLRIVAKGAE